MRHVGVEPLTPQQGHVLALVSQGLLHKQIAYELTSSEATVKAHVSAIIRKFDVFNPRQAMEIAERLGILSDGPHG